MKKLLHISIFIIFLTSCSSVNKATSTEKTLELNDNLSGFYGIYKNKPLNGDTELYSLWSTLNFRAKKHKNWSDLKVRLKSNSENQVVAELIDDKKIHATKILKGKIKNGFFKLKNQYNSNFRYIVIWGIGDSSVKIGIGENKELIVFRQSGGTAFFVAFPVFASDTPIIETKYKRME